MKTRIMLITLLLATAALAQTGTSQPAPAQSGQKPAGTQPPANSSEDKFKDMNANIPPTQAAAVPRHAPAAKTGEELEAYKAAAGLAGSDVGAAEKAADDFSTKYTDSELRAPLYAMIMQYYNRQGKDDKVVDVGNKALAIDPEATLPLIMTASALAEHTRDTDLDKEQSFATAMKNADTALKTMDTALLIPAQVPPEQVAGIKSQLRAMAHGAMGYV